MAKKEPELPIKLTDEDKKMLRDLEIDIERAKKASKALKEMGVDTTSIDDKIAYSEKARNILLEEFS